MMMVTVAVVFGLLIPKLDAYSVLTASSALEMKTRSSPSDTASSSSSSSSLQPAALLSSRRHVLLSIVGSATSTVFAFQPAAVVHAIAAEDNNKSIDGDSSSASPFRYELRDRNMNRNAVIREDYWYMLGKNPPRLLSGPLRGDDPQWNAFGTCTTSTDPATGAVTGNSCTYVSLSLRIPAYSKYSFAISYGAKEYAKLGSLLNVIAENKGNSNNDALWDEAASFVQNNNKASSIPPAMVDAELKMVLLATALLTSPNFPQPGRELLVARYYANEVHFAHTEMLDAIQQRDLQRAVEAWKFGRDSWNSYFQVVNRSIVPKVGDQFEAIA